MNAYVVTGGGRGIGRAVVERLAADAAVVVVERDEAAGSPQAARIAAEMAGLHPLARVAEPAEIAAAVAFLLGVDSAFLTGATLPLDGGRTILGREPDGA